MLLLDAFWGGLAWILGWVVPKNPKLVLFCGRHYGGNTAPLYERCSRLGLVGAWLSKTKTHDSSLEAIYTYSWKGVWLAARASAVVLTHSIGDLRPLSFPRKRTKIFNVWHGMPIKRISKADPDFWTRPYAQANLREQRRYAGMFVTSKAMANIFCQTFEIQPDRVFVTGQPRNDVILGSSIDLEKHFSEPLPAHQKRILYCPTWRDGEQVRLFPFDDFDEEQLQVELEKNQAIILVRTHPNDPGRLTHRQGRLIPMQGDVVPEITDALSSIDALITDYSSVYYDYLMLDRPTIFLDYDLERYEERPGFYLPFDDIAAGARPKSFAEFLKALEEAFAGDARHAESRQRTRELVYDLIDDGASERVLKVIADTIS